MSPSDVIFRSRRSTAGLVSSLVFVILCLSPLALVVGVGGSTFDAIFASAISVAIALWAIFMIDRKSVV